LRQAHAARNVWSFGELGIIIAHDLDAIAPGVTEIKKRTVDERGNSRVITTGSSI
jgi:hypothetical protein